MDLTQITDPLCEHAEGPCWSPRWGGLRWVDMLRGRVMSLSSAGQVSHRTVGAVAAVVRPRAEGGAIIATERGFLLEASDGTLQELPDVVESSRLRMNEGGCAPDGSFYCGSMAYDQEVGAASVYRLRPDLSVTTEVTGVTISNGLDFTDDGARAYYNDSAAHRIDVFDWDPELGLHGRRPFVTLADGGAPDGLTLDAEGGIWCAVFNQGAVHRYTPDGTLDAVLTLPVKQVTACTFGGDDLDTLYITTSRENLAPDDDPLAGSLFAARPGVRGRPVRPFRG